MGQELSAGDTKIDKVPGLKGWQSRVVFLRPECADSPLGIPRRCSSDPVGLGWRWRCYISNELLGDADASSPGATRLEYPHRDHLDSRVIQVLNFRMQT